MEFLIRLRSVRDVNEFVQLAKPLHRVIVTDGIHTVDGKEFMEIFCLRLSTPLTVRVECSQEEYDRFYQECQSFLVK